MTNSFKNKLPLRGSALTLSLLILAACNPTEIPSSGQRVGSSYANAGLVNKAYIYPESPAIMEGPNYGPKVNMKNMLSDVPVFITDNTQLKGDCTFMSADPIENCIHSYASKTASQQSLTVNPDGSWVFPTNSSEFYQVNGLYHVQKGVNTFFQQLTEAYQILHENPMVMWRESKIPKYLPYTGLYWFKSIGNENYFRYDFLSTYSLCNLETNASFSPAGPELCFGKWSGHPNFFFVQDPSVVYHEFGHAMIAIMMNMRNGIGTSFTPPVFETMRSNLNSYGYDEAGSLGEGIADYFSFVMNKRTHIGEWALKKSLGASRPMSEDDALHIPGIDTTPEGRLSYPQYLLYDPNQPNIPFEDVHYAGQIISHYLVALTKSLQNDCGFEEEKKHEKSTSFVMLLLAETLAEIGDLRAVGVDRGDGNYQFPGINFTNLDQASSYLWSHVVNPPTFRRFFQIFGKNINKYIADPTYGICKPFDRNKSEKLLDDYGLLLFKNYNDNGSSTTDPKWEHELDGDPILRTTRTSPTQVNENNRRKSVLVSKELLTWATPDDEKDVAMYYIIDDQENVSDILGNLLFKGYPMNLSDGLASIEYNNSNIKISPGEIVALVPNLYNSSNSTIAGVQLLANDWDHVEITDTTQENGNFAPCEIDTVTTQAQGAVTGNTCDSTMSTHKRHTPDSAGKFSMEAAAPVCMVQLEEGEVTRWVSQNEFRKKQGLSLQDKDCLGNGGTAETSDFTFNPHECLLRVLPGAQEAFYSKILPQKSYVETVRTGNPEWEFNPGNAIVFEVNKWIPPGTKFRCRFRVRYSNCSDCFEDLSDTAKDDYIDRELNGHKPFKILNFEFDIND